MSPKEKAEEIYQKFHGVCVVASRYPSPASLNRVKRAAMIAVDEVIEQWKGINAYLADMQGRSNEGLKYWYEVKKELELL
jgi:hypothetical protein